MDSLIDKYREIWAADPRSLLKEYSYYPALTRDLDRLKPQALDRATLYRIVLWKLGRFPELDDELVRDVALIAKLQPKQHRKARDLLYRLLRCPGIALPMASTILRFVKPTVFQIIDDRAYRVLLPGKPKYPTKPVKLSNGYLRASADIYFDYLDELHRVSSKKLPFRVADRILYQLDIALGNAIGTKNLTTRLTRTRRKRRAD